MFKFSRNRLLSRRQALTIGISSVTALTVLSLGKLKVLSYLIYTLTDRQQIKDNERRTFRVVGKTALKNRAKAKGLIYGALPHTEHQIFQQNPKFQSSFVRECNLIVAGFFWANTRPTATTFDFTGTDYYAKFATDRQLLLRGHPLVWHLALPNWLKSTLNHQNAERILTNHIQTVVKRYAGKMHSWDVVNEAIEIGDRRSDNFRKTPWLEFLGTDYVELAFRTAARSDPKALLVYNDWGLEYSEAHQEAVFKLLERLKTKGTPIHALGIQSHLDPDRHGFNPQKFRKFIQDISKLGLKVMITELDVMDNKLPLDIIKRDRIVAGMYEDYLDAVLAEKSVIAVINWGLSDRYTWLTEMLPRQDRAPARPLPLDRDLQQKLAWNAIARAFDRAPNR
jgi:endo-1,4-beta-xylanase